MKYFLNVGILISVLLSSCTKRNEQPVYREFLNHSWEFRSHDDSIWRSAMVPGTNFLDLMHHGIISDPFYADNEKQVGWVAEKDWHYRTNVNISDAVFESGQKRMVFTGLDSHAKIFVNKELVLQTDNMFRTYFLEIDKYFNQGRNEVEIIFESPLKYNKDRARQLAYQLPDERVFTRKAPYQFGWDWGPELITSGIYRAVYIESYSNFAVTDFHIQTLELKHQAAILYASFNIDCLAPGQYEAELLSDDAPDLQEKFYFQASDGPNEICWKFTIKNPKLWWPNNYGKQSLYHFTLTIRSKDFYQTAETEIGIRTIELIEKPDMHGKSFQFEINGLAIFAKGANYIPQDNFLNRVDSSRIERLIDEALFANMNMLRVWGGGIYEQDYFYELCTRKGILIWQDFMFACAMYPGDEHFLRNVEEEAKEQIIRLRKHTSIALWCGNNEVDNGWKDWGWQKQFNYSPADEATIYSDYQLLFEALLPGLVRSYHPGMDYHPSSPSFGWGHPESLTEGDNHYWGVWWGMEDFEIYKTKTGRFMSEYGFQAFPDYSLIEQYLPTEAHELFHPVLLNHQKHPVGNQTIEDYMNRYFVVPAHLSDFAYVSQLLQAYGIGKAISYHRMQQPYCMGTLYWQLNDCWPVVSWSSIDYHYNRKALHYKVRDLFKTYMIGLDEQSEEYFIKINSDSMAEIKAELRWQLIDFKGEVLAQNQKEIIVPALSNQVHERIFLEDFPPFNPESSIWKGELYFGDTLLAFHHHFFVRPKFFELEPSADVLHLKVEKEELVLTATGFVVGLYFDFLTENNYFDLLPGEQVRLKLPDQFDKQSKLQYQCLNDIKKKSHP